MIIRQTNMNLVYPRISEYRKKFLGLEDVLENHFMPSTILPIPEQVQDEVPRIIVQSKNGHSVLNIALSVASLSTNYDGEFVRDWGKCRCYLEQRCSDVYQLINGMTENNNIFVGLITNVEIDELDDTGLEVLKKSLLHHEAKEMGEIYDVECKLTYAYKERYYINITMENLREFLVEQYSNGKACITQEKKHTILASIDVNDRYAVNNNPDYVSGQQSFEEIMKITDHIINNKLENLVRKGEFIYDM